MKKITALILAVMMACLLIPAMAAEDVTGTWYLKSMSQGGQTMDASILSAMGMSGEITINEDGSLVINMFGTETKGTWTLEGEKLAIVTTDEGAESKVEATVANGELSLGDAESGTVMLFTREAPAAGYVPAEVITNARLEDFAGKWTVKYIGAQGMIFDIDSFTSFIATLAASMGSEAEVEIPDIGSMMALEIEGSTITIGSGDERNSVEATYEDGKLTAKDEASGEAIVLSIQEDGILAMEANYSGMLVVIYCIPAAAAEAPAA